VPVIVVAYLLMTIALARALMDLGRRLLFGAVQNCGRQRTIKPCPFQKDVEPPATAAGLWDRWIDGPRHRPEPRSTEGITRKFEGAPVRSTRSGSNLSGIPSPAAITPTDCDTGGAAPSAVPPRSSPCRRRPST
jgi:hypothetical protein